MCGYKIYFILVFQDRRNFGKIRDDSSDSAIEFTVPDDELAEFDHEEKEPRLNKFASEMNRPMSMNMRPETSQSQPSSQNKPKKKRKFGMKYKLASTRVGSRSL